MKISYSGNSVNSGFDDATSGLALHYGPCDPRNMSGKMPNTLEQFTTNAEIAAALRATRKTALNVSLTLESSRNVVLKVVTKDLGKSEDKGWVGVKNSELTRVLGAALRARKAVTVLAVRSENSRGCAEASENARAACREPETAPIELSLEIQQDFELPGASIQSNPRIGL